MWKWGNFIINKDLMCPHTLCLQIPDDLIRSSPPQATLDQLIVPVAEDSDEYKYFITALLASAVLVRSSRNVETRAPHVYGEGVNRRTIGKFSIMT
jgi:hypothetical protein